ncbi:hypothetical protein D3C81_1654510 [compost metagenome]
MEHLLDVLLFFFLGDAFQVSACRRGRVCSLGQGLAVAQFGEYQGEVALIDRCTLQQVVGRERGAFEDVFQFADIAGPGIRHEGGLQCLQQACLQWRGGRVRVQAMQDGASDVGDVFTAFT